MPPFVACTIYFSYFKATLIKLYRSIFCPKDEILILFHTQVLLLRPSLSVQRVVLQDELHFT